MLENYVKYPKIPHLHEELSILGNPVEVFEKLDGGNAQVRRLDFRVRPGNRSKFLDERHTTQFWFPAFYGWAMKNQSFLNLPDNVVCYGEWLAEHTLRYRDDAKDRFYLLDIYDLDKKRFLHYRRGIRLLKGCGVKGVKFLKPIVSGKVSLDELEEIVTERDSDYRKGGEKMEGVVVKDYNSQRFAKLWRTSVVGFDYDSVISGVMFSLVEDGEELSMKNLLGKTLSLLKEGRMDYNEGETLRKVSDFWKLYRHGNH